MTPSSDDAACCFTPEARADPARHLRGHLAARGLLPPPEPRGRDLRALVSMLLISAAVCWLVAAAVVVLATPSPH